MVGHEGILFVVGKLKMIFFVKKKSFLKPINQPKDASDTVFKTTLHLASHLLRKK